MKRRAWTTALVMMLVAGDASGDPILPSPGAKGYDSKLADLALAYQRQLDVFAARESGVSLDVIVKPDKVQLVKDFFAQSTTDDFKQFSGAHAFDVISKYEEHGDMGNFSGVGSVGIAARLITLRKINAPSVQIAAARAAAVRAARTWHVYGAIAKNGIVARGVRRTVPEVKADPPLPDKLPQLVPLADGSGNPLPAKKVEAWRAPVAAGFDEWIWLDNTSKDQVSGYALGAAWLWDALRDDPAVPLDVTDALAADLAAFAKQLMKLAPERGIDLCLRDADGRLTGAYDLNARMLFPDGAPLPEDSTLQNGFNAALSLGIIRAAYHVSGDPEVGRYYYDELVRKRDYPALMAKNAGVIFVGTATNYSNVNMLAIALATLGRFESEPEVRSRLQETLQKQFWSTGNSRDVSHVKQAWFDAIYGAYAAAPPPEIRTRVGENLAGFNPPPAFLRDRVNCDEAEIGKGVCVAIDGTTMIKLAVGKGHGGGVMAESIVPMSLRPDSDFQWRSDPHSVNGNGGPLMAPGGDFMAAYWLSRSAELGGADQNASPHARPPLPADAGQSGQAEAASSGCSVGRAQPCAWLGLLALMATATSIRAKSRQKGGSVFFCWWPWTISPQ
jgi:hypothetical protein